MKNIEELKKIKEALEVLINESEKPKFEVGKWYKGGEYLICPTDLTDPNNAKGYGLSSGIWKNFENFVMNGVSKMTEATTSEVQGALEKEAEKRGFKEGSKIKDLQTGNIKTLKFKELSFYSNMLCDGYGCAIFENNEWATPIKTKTIDEIVDDMYECTKYDLKEYLTKNKQDIINALNNL